MTVVFATACGADCVLLEGRGLEVRLIDAVTREPIINGAVVTSTIGGVVDTLSLGASGSTASFMGRSREGLATVRVESSRYRTEIRSDVRIARSGSCDHLQPTVLTVELRQP